jgi:hypothetical protein
MVAETEGQWGLTRVTGHLLEGVRSTSARHRRQSTGSMENTRYKIISESLYHIAMVLQK